MKLSFKDKIIKYIYNIWYNILLYIQKNVEKRVIESEELYGVYQPMLSDEIYICKNGEYALELYNQLVKVNILLNRTHTPVFYGKVDHIFKHRIFKVLDIVFTWSVSGEESRKIYSYIADVPLK